MAADAQREDVLFQAAVQLTGPARASFLEAISRSEPALRQRLETPLAAHQQAGGVLGEDLQASPETIRIESPEAADAAVGQIIGRYKVLQKIGEGGCGAVYMAEQETPVRRRVALKVIIPKTRQRNEVAGALKEALDADEKLSAEAETASPGK